VTAAIENYPELNAERLYAQLAMLRQQSSLASTVVHTVTKIVLMPSVVRSLFDQVQQYLVTPIPAELFSLTTFVLRIAHLSVTFNFYRLLELLF
jgi:hypothetical protein